MQQMYKMKYSGFKVFAYPYREGLEDGCDIVYISTNNTKYYNEAPSDVKIVKELSYPYILNKNNDKVYVCKDTMIMTYEKSNDKSAIHKDYFFQMYEKI